MIICVFSNTFFKCDEEKIKIFFGMSLCERHLKLIHQVAGGYSNSIHNAMDSFIVFEDAIKIDQNQRMAKMKEERTGG